jgi:tRNA/rRNA methyltransferase
VTADVRFVLVRPRSPGNVGSVARAMKNFGLRDLVLVDPRLHRAGDSPGEEPYFEREARRMAWHAADVLESSRTVATLAQALEGVGFALATAPRATAGLEALGPEEAAGRLAAEAAHPPALVFGSESSGLTLEELALCAGVVVIPTSPAYRDLNLAQSAGLLAYLIFRSGGGVRAAAAPERATQEMVAAVGEDLLDLALQVRFLHHRESPVGRELRGLLQRAGLSRREAGLLRSLGKRVRARLRGG